MKINLVSSPRNRSTLLMYAFAQRTDTQVIDEPFYANYLHTSETDHPGKNAVLQSQPINRETVQTTLLENTSPVLFIKNMAHHYSPAHFPELLSFINILYIRNPRAVIRSYAKVISQPSKLDIGIHNIKNIYDYLLSNNKNKPLIFDSDDLITNPKEALENLCRALEIEFTDSMLSWNAGAKPYDGIWAKHWYTSVHASTGFKVNPLANSEEIKLAPHLEELAEECMPIYKALKQHSI